MSSTHKILCGNCNTPVQGPSEPSDGDLIECPSCGQSDRYLDVVKSAQACATEVVSKKLQKRMESAARGSKFMTFKVNTVPERTHRWIVDDLHF